MLFDYITTKHRTEYNISSEEDLIEFLKTNYTDNIVIINNVLLDLCLFYKNISDKKIQTILDFILHNISSIDNSDKPFLMPYRTIIFMFLKRNINPNFKRFLRIAFDAYNLTLSRILDNIDTLNRDIFIDVLTTFKLQDILHEIYMYSSPVIKDILKSTENKTSNAYFKFMKNVDLELKLPLTLNYTVDDISTMLSLNSEITPLQLSIITGLNIQTIMKDYSILFQRFSSIIFDYLDEHIPFNTQSYILSQDKYNEIYMMEKEHYKIMIDELYIINKRKHIYPHIINKKDITDNYIDQRRLYKQLRLTTYKDFYPNVDKPEWYKETYGDVKQQTFGYTKQQPRNKSKYFDVKTIDTEDLQELNSLTVEQLKKVCVYKKKHGYSKLRKQELIDLLFRK